MMDSNNTLHRMVLEALGYHVVGGMAYIGFQFGLHNAYTDELIMDNGHGFETIADAWAQAPSLESLTKPLIKALGLKNTVMIDVTPQGQFIVTLGYSQSNAEAGTPLTAAHVGIFAASTSLDEAVASVFVAAVRQRLVDVESVVI